jgi:signal transduction histidine kinase
MDDIRVIPRFGHVPDVLADESQFEDVFLNLLNNAQQALQSRGGEITVTTATVDDRVIITFGDNGPGIPDDVRARIFEPFFTTREVGAGEGWGCRFAPWHGHGDARGGSGPAGGTQASWNYRPPGSSRRPRRHPGDGRYAHPRRGRRSPDPR